MLNPLSPTGLMQSCCNHKRVGPCGVWGICFTWPIVSPAAQKQLYKNKQKLKTYATKLLNHIKMGMPLRGIGDKVGMPLRGIGAQVGMPKRYASN